MTKQNPSALLEGLGHAIDGLKAIRKKHATITLDGVATKTDDLIKVYEAWRILYQHAEEAEHEAHVAVKSRDRVHPLSLKSLQQLQRWASVALGEDSPAFKALGFEPRKKARELTSEEKAARAAKAKATRQGKTKAP